MAVAWRRTGPGCNVETTRTSLDKDQPSLTALNVRGLVHLDSLYTLLIAGEGLPSLYSG